MKVLPKNLLVSVAGGEADEVVFAYSGDSSGGGEMWGSDFGWDDSGDSVFGGGGSAIVSAGFDSQGVGMTSCVAMPPPPPPVPSGLFGYSMTETLTLAGALGGGAGASVVVESIGGWGAIGSLGAAGVGVSGGALAGLSSAVIVGYGIGGAIYNNSETVQEWSQKAWGGVFQVIESATQSAAETLHIDRKPHPVYHP